MGFFEASEVVSKGKPPSGIPQCGACGLSKLCSSPKLPVFGQGRMKILIVGDKPGPEEDSYGRHFVGPAGAELSRILSLSGVELEQDCWSTNSLICATQGNKEPTTKEIDYCRANLISTVKKLKPEIILLMGFEACRSLLGPLWKSEAVGKLDKWVGWQIPSQRYNAWICPTYHPSFILESEKDRLLPVIRLLTEQYIRDAVELVGRPWDTAPDYRKAVTIILDPTDAAAAIRRMIAAGKPCSFDYETNRLKPDHPKSAIYSCAICCNGEETISYPWVGEAITATKEFLASPVPKIGANTKFEDRWSRAILQTPVNNWVHDTMLMAHILDNRESISSVKFQAFVRLGLEDWSWRVAAFFESGDDGFNQIHRIDLKTLLLYNGIDSIAEYKIAVHQKKELAGG